jgi:ankyrin repeat protein
MKIIGSSMVVLLWLRLPLFTGCASLHKSVEKGDVSEMERCLQKGIDVNALDPYGRTPLMCAAGDLRIATYLVERGADVNARNDEGETPLMYADERGHQDVADYLVKKGATD